MCVLPGEHNLDLRRASLKNAGCGTLWNLRTAPAQVRDADRGGVPRSSCGACGTSLLVARKLKMEWGRSCEVTGFVPIGTARSDDCSIAGPRTEARIPRCTSPRNARVARGAGPGTDRSNQLPAGAAANRRATDGDDRGRGEAVPPDGAAVLRDLAECLRFLACGYGLMPVGRAALKVLAASGRLNDRQRAQARELSLRLSPSPYGPDPDVCPQYAGPCDDYERGDPVTVLV